VAKNKTTFGNPFVNVSLTLAPPNVKQLNCMTKILLVVCFSVLCVLSNDSFAQVRRDSLNIQQRKTSNINLARFERVVTTVNDSVYQVTVSYLTGESFMTGIYSDIDLLVGHGDFTYFYANGYKESEGRIKNGFKVGTWKRWNFEGKPKPDRFYPDENFVKTNRSSQPAKFPGGMAALQVLVTDSLIYPDQAKTQKIQGTVYVTFTIDATGEVSQPQVTDGVHQVLDEEALRFVSSLPTWVPAAKGGVPVDSNYIMPITFDLGIDEEPTEEIDPNKKTSN
jgi:TonB family protein